MREKIETVLHGEKARRAIRTPLMALPKVWSYGETFLVPTQDEDSEAVYETFH